MTITIEDGGKNNAVVGSTTPQSKLTVKFVGNNNRVEIGDNVHLSSSLIVCRASDQTVRLAGRNRLSLTIYMSGLRTSVVIGEGTSSNGLVWMNVGEADDSVTIGRDCLFATIKLRTSDSHPIFDIESGDRINPSRSITIGDHVWIAEDTLILKGATIGSGAAIGARSLVSGSLPDSSLCVGAPARVVRSGIRWAETF